MKRTQARRLLGSLIGHAPTNALRCGLYAALMGYRFGAKTRIGWGTVIAVDAFSAGANVTVRRGNRFIGPISVELGDRAFIGRRNTVECGDAAADLKVAHMKYTRRFVAGADTLINEGHLFDVLGEISIGRGTWIAGFASQFLTHGAGTMNRDIALGDDCFVGSAVRFAPGSGVADRVVVGMAAVLTKRFTQSDVVIAGFPARVIKERTEDDGYAFKKTW